MADCFVNILLITSALEVLYQTCTLVEQLQGNRKLHLGKKNSLARIKNCPKKLIFCTYVRNIDNISSLVIEK